MRGPWRPPARPGPTVVTIGSPTTRRATTHEEPRPSDSEVDRVALASQVLRQMTLALPAANLLGATLVALFLFLVVPLPVARVEGEQANLVVTCGCVVLGTVVGIVRGRRTGQPVTTWLLEGKALEAGQRDRILRQALTQAANVGLLWVMAAVVLGTLNAYYSAALGVQVAVTVALGGVTTTALCYLFSERIIRPVMALVLADHPPSQPMLPGVVTRMLLAWVCGTGLALLGAGLVSGEFLATGRTSPQRLAATVLFLCVVALFAGLFTTMFAAHSLADPIDSIRQALAEVEAGSIDVQVAVYDGSELGLLQAGFNSMVAGLRERERIRDLFGRHVGRDVAWQALAREVQFSGETREVAVVFVDLIGSTAMAASHDPVTVVAALNQFFAVVVEVIAGQDGWVNKFEGDAALSVFGAPGDHPNPAAGALVAARELRARLEREMPTVAAGIGVSAGRVVAGNIGTADRYEYTVIGDTVNEAARLCELAKKNPGHLLASDAALARAGETEAANWSLGDSVTLRGRSQTTRLATAVSVPASRGDSRRTPGRHGG